MDEQDKENTRIEDKGKKTLIPADIGIKIWLALFIILPIAYKIAEIDSNDNLQSIVFIGMIIWTAFTFTYGMYLYLVYLRPKAQKKSEYEDTIKVDLDKTNNKAEDVNISPIWLIILIIMIGLILYGLAVGNTKIATIGMAGCGADFVVGIILIIVYTVKITKNSNNKNNKV